MRSSSRPAPAPHLQSQRLVLSPYREEDFADVASILTDPRIIWWRETPMSEDLVRQFFNRAVAAQADGFGWWLVREPGGPLLGHAALWPLASRPGTIEVGYHFRVEGRGRGFATEAARALLDYGFGPRGLSEFTPSSCRRTRHRKPSCGASACPRSARTSTRRASTIFSG